MSGELGRVQSDHVHNVPSLIIGHLLLPGELNGLHAVWEGVWRVGCVGGEGCGGVGVCGRASLKERGTECIMEKLFGITTIQIAYDVSV